MTKTVVSSDKKRTFIFEGIAEKSFQVLWQISMKFYQKPGTSSFRQFNIFIKSNTNTA